MEKFESDPEHARARLARKRSKRDDPLKMKSSNTSKSQKKAKKSLQDDKSVKVSAVVDETHEVWVEVVSSNLHQFGPHTRFVNLIELPDSKPGNVAEKVILKHVTVTEKAITNPVTVAKKDKTNPVTAAKDITKPVTLAKKATTNPVTVPEKVLTKPVTVTEKALTKPVIVAEKILTKPVTVAKKEIRKTVTVPEKALTNPVTEVENSLTNPVTEVENSLTNPVTEAEKALTNPVTEAKKDKTNPMTVPEKALTNPVTDAEKALTNPVTEAEKSLTEPVTVAVTKPVLRSNRILFTEEHRDLFFTIIQGPRDKVIINKFTMKIYRRDIRALARHNVVNESIMTFYLKILYYRAIDNVGKLPTVYPFSIFFMECFMENGYERVSPWTRKVDIFSKDILIVPFITRHQAWCMIIINMRLKSVKMYNWIGKTPPRCMDIMAMYLKSESLEKLRKRLDFSVFKYEVVEDLPMLSDPNDSGVVSLMLAESITRGRTPINFNSNDIRYFRYLMVFEVASGKLWR